MAYFLPARFAQKSENEFMELCAKAVKGPLRIAVSETRCDQMSVTLSGVEEDGLATTTTKPRVDSAQRDTES